MRIAIDAGHGGHEPGATVPPSHEEEDITLALSASVAVALRARKHEVLETRTADKYLGLSDRAARSNAFRADVFISIHANAASSPAANGAWVIFAAGSIKGRALAGAVFDAIRKVPGAEDADPDAEVYPDASAWVTHRKLTVLRKTKAPAILIEAGFMTNKGDLGDLRDPLFRSALTQAICDGIEAWGIEMGYMAPTLPEIERVEPRLEDSMKALREWIEPLGPVTFLDMGLYAAADRIEDSGPNEGVRVREFIGGALEYLWEQPAVRGAVEGAAREGVEAAIRLIKTRVLSLGS